MYFYGIKFNFISSNKITLLSYFVNNIIISFNKNYSFQFILTIIQMGCASSKPDDPQPVRLPTVNGILKVTIVNAKI